MKAVFIAYNEAYNEEIIEILDSFGQRGFTRWTDISGRGAATGDPHYGSHAWPIKNHAMLTVVDDTIVAPLLEALHAKDLAFEDLGLRAFSWAVEEMV